MQTFSTADTRLTTSGTSTARTRPSLVAGPIGLAVASALIIVACATPGPRETMSAERFAMALQGSASYDYDPFESPDLQREAADLVVVGTISDAVVGRTLPYGRANRQTNLIVDVQEVLSGKSDDVLYVEVPLDRVDSASAEDVAAPAGRVLLFLDDRTDVDSTDGAAGRPEGTAIFTPFTQGLIFETEKGWVSGMVDSSDWSQRWLVHDSFDDLVAATKE